MSLLAPTLQLFFSERLVKQRQASPATVTSYKVTFRLLLRLLSARQNDDDVDTLADDGA
jgi:hypothetical protein